MKRYLLFIAVMVSIPVVAASCFGGKIPKNSVKSERTLLVTAYCECKECTEWKRNWLFRPVFATGPLKGKPKRVGVTASGTRAKKGTIAADTSFFPFGTVMKVPGYGWGRVEDRGSAIKGNHIDLYFKDHGHAMQWGSKRMKVTVWIPR